MDEAVVAKRLWELADQQVTSRETGSRGSAATHDPEDDNLLGRFGFSSLDALEFILTIEDEFGIIVEDEDVDEKLLASTKTLVHYICEKAAAAAAAS